MEILTDKCVNILIFNIINVYLNAHNNYTLYTGVKEKS